jgi:hypothetical protein
MRLTALQEVDFNLDLTGFAEEELARVLAEEQARALAGDLDLFELVRHKNPTNRLSADQNRPSTRTGRGWYAGILSLRRNPPTIPPWGTEKAMWPVHTRAQLQNPLLDLMAILRSRSKGPAC